MADTATPPAPPDPNPPAPAPPPTVPPPAPNPPPAPTPPRADIPVNPQPAYLTKEQFDSELERRLAERESKWESDRVPKLREQIRESIEAPIRRQAKVSAFRQELQASGKYQPSDDDCTDPKSPGDIAALSGLDDSKTVFTDKDGKTFTQLDIELNRVRQRLSKRTPKKTGDQLGTPPVEVNGDEFQKIRDDVLKAVEAKTKNQQRPLTSVFGGFVPASTR